jgi:hypothetical protein
MSRTCLWLPPLEVRTGTPALPRGARAVRIHPTALHSRKPNGKMSTQWMESQLARSLGDTAKGRTVRRTHPTAVLVVVFSLSQEKCAVSLLSRQGLRESLLTNRQNGSVIELHRIFISITSSGRSKGSSPRHSLALLPFYTVL